MRTSGTTLRSEVVQTSRVFKFKVQGLPQDSPEGTCGPPHLHVSVTVHFIVRLATLPATKLQAP